MVSTDEEVIPGTPPLPHLNAVKYNGIRVRDVNVIYLKKAN
jgi:hypothetical protein